MFRHVTEFKLHASGYDNHRYFAHGKSDVIKKTLQKHLSKSNEKSGDTGVGSELFHKGHNKNADDNYMNHVDGSEKKSCTESVSE